MLAVATCNYPASVPDCNGGSSVFDGVAYLPELEGSRDTCILQAGGEEGIYLARLDLQQLRRYRETEVHGNAYRRPKRYGLLVDTQRRGPFLRPDYRGKGRGRGPSRSAEPEKIWLESIRGIWYNMFNFSSIQA